MPLTHIFQSALLTIHGTSASLTLAWTVVTYKHLYENLCNFGKIHVDRKGKEDL